MSVEVVMYKSIEGCLGNPGTLGSGGSRVAFKASPTTLERTARWHRGAKFHILFSSFPPCHLQPLLNTLKSSPPSSQEGAISSMIINLFTFTPAEPIFIYQSFGHVRYNDNNVCQCCNKASASGSPVQDLDWSRS